MWFQKLYFSFFTFALLFTPVTLVYSANPDVVFVPGSPSPAMTQSEVVKQTLKSEVDATTFPVIALEPVASVKMQTLSEQNSIPKQIGFNRNVAMLSTAENTKKQLSWLKFPENNHYAGIKISSPKALALRVGITVKNLPEDAEFRFFGIQEGISVDIQPISGREILDILRNNRKADPTDLNGEIFWSPTVSGDTIGVEIYLQDNYDLSSLQIAFPLISHITSLPFDPKSLKISFQGYGDSDPCQNDATCAISWVNLNKSVAGMQFTTNVGTYVCTGSLLNDLDPDSFKPYFITANHCIDRQSVASTLETQWLWQSATCNSSTLNSLYRKISGGATLLHTQAMSSGEPTSTSMDTTLLVLNNKPAAGVWFAGWTTGVPPGTGTPRTGIHHPKADWKKISYGTSAGYAACGWADAQGVSCFEGSGNFYIVHWTDGGVEPGSSGSGIYFDRNYLIGTLTGGNGSCAGSYSVYSSFRAAYAAGNYGQWLYSLPEQTDVPEQAAPIIAPIIYFLLSKQSEL